MLSSLRIQNIALIPQVEIEFDRAFNVLTGETGAGKSIIIGSFNFILGDKLKPSVIRSGEKFARVDAVFSVGEAVAEQIVELTGIEIETERNGDIENGAENGMVILTRTLKTDGKSECRINGNVVTVAMLKDVASNLIHIHGQHEHETLLKPKNHIDIVDGFGGVEVAKVKSEYIVQYEKLLKLRGELKSFGGSDEERDRLVDIYKYQIREIESANLRENEDEELQEFKQRMINFEKIYGALNSALDGFRGLNYREIVSAIGLVSKLDSAVDDIHQRARGIQYEIDDIESNIQSYIDGLEYDEEKFKIADARLDEIKVLKRKHGGTVSQVLAFLEKTKAELEHLTRSAEDIENIKRSIEEQERTVIEYGERLTEARKRAAGKFSVAIVGQLKDLGMPACKLEVRFGEIKPSSNGCDDVEFLFSANAGESVKPLASIISGGEMSRFMLALKTVIAGLRSVDTLVFDEIDTGVGGNMGTKIAEKIQILSRSTQVICVTHLSQIAAMADSHFLIHKTEADGKTTTGISKLTSPQQIDELARMVGAVAGDVTAREHALAVKKFSDTFKQG